MITIEQAAGWMGIKVGTLFNWISRKRFTRDDGLRRIGGCTRIHLPTLKERVHNETLLNNPGLLPMRKASSKASEAERRVDLHESLRDVEVATPEPEFQVH